MNNEKGIEDAHLMTISASLTWVTYKNIVTFLSFKNV